MFYSGGKDMKYYKISPQDCADLVRGEVENTNYLYDDGDMLIGFKGDINGYEPLLTMPNGIRLPIEDKKDEKLNELNRLFNQNLARTEIEVDGVGVVDAGERYLANANTLYELCPDDGELDFILADNSSVKIGKDKLLSIKNAIAKTGVELYAKKHELRNQILNANSVDELDKISIDL